MISEQISKSIDARLTEVQKLLAHIKNLEEVAIRDKDIVSAEYAAILRGLFFVHLYGTFEYSITLSVQVLLQEITKVGVPYGGIEHLLHVVALDADFKSIVDAGGEKKWTKRKELLKRQISPDPCCLNDTVFDHMLQNVWYQTLDAIFDYLCIPQKPVPEDRFIGYIDDIVGNRNEVAHGDSSASKVGRLTTSSEHEKRLDAITQVVNHVTICFDEYLMNRKFIVEAQRSQFIDANSMPPAPPA